MVLRRESTINYKIAYSNRFTNLNKAVNRCFDILLYDNYIFLINISLLLFNKFDRFYCFQLAT